MSQAFPQKYADDIEITIAEQEKLRNAITSQLSPSD